MNYSFCHPPIVEVFSFQGHFLASKGRVIQISDDIYVCGKICFITSGWHVTHDLNLLSLTMGANSNVSSRKFVTIMALKPNQLQITTINPQANAIIDQVHKNGKDTLRLFDLKNEKKS
jgi:hypothetical protein